MVTSKSGRKPVSKQLKKPGFDLLLRLLASTIPESYTGVPFLDQTVQTMGKICQPGIYYTYLVTYNRSVTWTRNSERRLR